MLIDTHCHLDQFADPQTVLAEAAAGGVSRVVAVSEDPDSMAAVLELQKLAPERVVAGLGLHPAWITRSTAAQVDAALAWLACHLDRASVLAEIGLDHLWADSADAQAYQSRTLDRLLSLAAEHGKPVGLHSRRCQRQTMECAIAFHKRTGLNAQLHWFTQSSKLVRICNEAGIFVSVGPTVLADPQTQAVAGVIADELLMLETDAPVPVHGQNGHPVRTREVAEALGRLKGVAWQEVAELTSANAQRFLSAPGNASAQS
jgi:TatD DNase family protein